MGSSAFALADDAGLGIKLKVDQRKLSNGLTLVMVEDPSVPVVTYQTWFRVGSVDERPGITGISHLFEHLMFKGTPKYGAKQFFLQLEARGAEVNAFTARDYTVYYETFTPDLLEKVIDMESDRLANITFDETSLGTERQVVFEERRLRTENTPSGKMQESLWALAYRRHPYQWPVIGYPQDLERIGVADLESYFKKHYNPANAAIVIVGNFKADDAYTLIRRHYEKIPGGERPVRGPGVEPEQGEERRLVLRDQVASERFAYAYHVTAATDDDSYALDVLANILFEGTSSRAYRRLVDEKDVTVGISGSAYTPAFPGLFIITGTMKGGLKEPAADELLRQVIREAQEKDVTDEEIRIAVRQLTVQMVDGVRTPYGLGQLIGTVMMIFGDPNRFNKDLEKYLKVSRADVRRVANKYLNPNNRSVVTLIPAEKPAPAKKAAAPAAAKKPGKQK